MREEQVCVGGIKLCLKWPSEEVESRVNVVFLLHGRKQRKEKLDSYAARFSSQGFLSVYGDTPNHGERTVDRDRNNGWSEGNVTHAIDMYAQMVQAVKELQLQLDFLPALLGLEFNKVCVFGISQGGHASLLSIVQEPRIDICVSVISSGDYMLNMSLRYQALLASKKDDGEEKPSFESLVPDGLRRCIATYDPIENCGKFVGKSVLLLNGGADMLVPLECNQKFFAAVQEVIRERQGDQRLMQHNVYAQIGHAVTEEMMSDSIQWVRAHL